VATEKDCWANWVALTRPGPESEDPDHPHWRWRDRILDAAEPIAGQTLLDVGCGEGLIAFGALQRGAGHVVFSDISRDLLDFCREAAATDGVVDRCSFVTARADDLGAIDDGSVDLVTTRSVLIYVSDKERAFDEFARVLRPGGQISIFEPINRFSRTAADTWMGYDVAAVRPLAAKVRAVYETIQPPDSDPMLNFDERDLLDFAEQAGFESIRLQLEAEVRQSDPASWATFVSTAGNPRIPTLAEAMDLALTQSERDELTASLRPLVEEGRGTARTARAFLSATKP
jgi:arsenite methyltransferase